MGSRSWIGGRGRVRYAQGYRRKEPCVRKAVVTALTKDSFIISNRKHYSYHANPSVHIRYVSSVRLFYPLLPGHVRVWLVWELLEVSYVEKLWRLEHV